MTQARKDWGVTGDRGQWRRGYRGVRRRVMGDTKLRGDRGVRGDRGLGFRGLKKFSGGSGGSEHTV